MIKAVAIYPVSCDIRNCKHVISITMSPSLLLLLSRNALAAWTAQLINSTDRISPYRPPNVSSGPAIALLSAARREHESFAVAFRHDDPINTTVHVSIPSLSAGNDKIPAAWLNFRQTGFVWVSNATDKTRTFAFDCPPDLLLFFG